MPRPLLLLQGENLSGADFSVSDASLHIDRTEVSANGHWAELWLSSSPAAPETITVTALSTAGTSSVAYRFEARRPLSDGFAGFSSRDAMYLIMTDRFADGDLANDGLAGNVLESSAEAAAERAKVRGWHGGDVRGVLQHLDYIQDLGFTTVWITPVYANLQEPSSYHGYGATDLYAMDPHYGTLADLQALSAELHRRHMKLVLDVVPNHVGAKSIWAEDEPDPQWLHGTRAAHHDSSGVFNALVDPHAPWRDRHYLLEGWFANSLPDMNTENPSTSQYLIQNTLWWIEQTAADGLRIDTFPYIARPFWRDYHAAIHGLYPNVTTVGEIYNCDATITSAFAGGVTRNGIDSGLDTPFDFPSFCALRDVFLKNEPMSNLPDVWRLDSLYPHPERLISFLGNHDNFRFANDKAATPARMRLAFAVLLTMRGMPQVYSGDEIAMPGGNDPDNRRDFPGGWPGTPQDAFTRRTPAQAAMHDWVRQLLTLRAARPSLLTGEMQVIDAGDDTLSYARVSPGETTLIVVNRKAVPAKLTLQLGETVLAGSAQPRTLLGNAVATRDGDQMQVQMPPSSVWIADMR